MNKYILILIITLSYIGQVFAAETCSRVAVINYQEVLVDPSTSTKGEGLRFYLDKDEKAREYLQTYQEENKPKWQTATLSTFGTGLIFAGILRSNKENTSGFSDKNTLILSGGIFIALSYLVSKTLQYKNEYNLKAAVDEYNKRNLPRIYFSPFIENENGGNKYGVGIQKSF